MIGTPTVDSVKIIMDTQLTEKELMIYVMVTNGMSLRDLANGLGVSHMSIKRVYDTAAKKMKVFADAGLFQTPVDK